MDQGGDRDEAAERTDAPISGAWRRRPLYLGICLGLLLSVGAGFVMLQWERRMDQIEFGALAENRWLLLQNGMRDYEDDLLAVQSYFDASAGQISRQEFESLTANMLERREGLRSLSWAPLVPGDQREAFETAATLSDLPNFKIFALAPDGTWHPAAERDEYFPIFYTAPDTKLSLDLGIDLGSQPQNSHALQVARDNDALSAFEVAELRTVPTEKRGLIMTAPLYAFRAPRDSLEERRRNFRGSVVAVLQISSIIRDILPAAYAGRNPELYFYALAARGNDVPVFAHVSDAAVRAPSFAALESTMHWSRDVRIADVRWKLVAVPSTNGASAIVDRAVLLFLFGLLLTSILGFYIRNSLHQSGRLERATEELRAGDRRLHTEVAHGETRGIALKNLTRALGHRIKALSFLAKSSKLRSNTGEKPAVILSWLVDALVAASKDPDCTAVRIKFDGETYESTNYRGVDTYRRVEISVNDVVRGSFDVGRLNACAPDLAPAAIDENVALVEESARDFASFVARLEADELLRVANRIVENSTTLLFRTGAEPGWPLSFISENVSRYGHSARDLYENARKLSDYMHPDDLEPMRVACERAVAGNRWEFEVEVRFRAADGTFYSMNSRIRILRDDRRRVVGFEGVNIDVTDRKRWEETLAYMAQRDSVTGLFNRAKFCEEVQAFLQRTDRGELSFAVHYLDLDRFKDINDTFGHEAGDELLHKVGERLVGAVRATDVVARLGGDEFAVLQARAASPEAAAAFAERLRDALAQPMKVGANPITQTTSIGIAFCGSARTDAATLLRQADLALYRAKEEGRNSYRFHSPDMDKMVALRVQTATELRTALAGDELFLVYQPEIDSQTLEIVGMETLVRWRHPTRGLISPIEFIPVAETTGLMMPLGKWILHQALRQGNAWLDSGCAPFILAVNVSVVQVRDGGFEADLLAVLEETGFPAASLELELTETAFFEASQAHQGIMDRLHLSGVRLAIDDFGTGYSSLEYLMRFHVDHLKIAQVFVDKVPHDRSASTIVAATIGLARDLGITVIAEGVERAEQFDFLRGLGCDQIQGYYFARPIPADELEPILRAGRISRPSPELSILPTPEGRTATRAPTRHTRRLRRKRGATAGRTMDPKP